MKTIDGVDYETVVFEVPMTITGWTIRGCSFWCEPTEVQAGKTYLFRCDPETAHMTITEEA
jgi:hypothetical protein